MFYYILSDYRNARMGDCLSSRDWRADKVARGILREAKTLRLEARWRTCRVKAKPPFFSVRNEVWEAHGLYGCYSLVAAWSQNKHGQEQYARSELPIYNQVAITDSVGVSQASVRSNTSYDVEKSRIE